MNSTGTFAFITNAFSNLVTRCSVNGDILSNCIDSGATVLSGPRGISLNSAGTFAFISNYNNGTITQCKVNGGTLSNCARTGTR